ncbi:DNA polymerase delta subunit 2 [Monomorium pharaonis]|uniref:DNA polymerase delta subunit 2 n=1 Tax=Monomorium pharaonis TaxID=307658 RepID=UPI00063F894F|nr:DNA polymerase delta subunit 2 [Monomorium pharaonis]XP_012526914.1 DNA polymerase delta subunit 2 [Monomorium pharaonis]XP_012526915.1 DNA polymerase delta subunit 2 [Monomorium pharaonis]
MVHTTESAGNLLSTPGNEKPQELKRQPIQYEDLTGNFDDKVIDFSKQFCSIYAARLAELREILVPRVVAKWGEVQILKLAELEDFEGEECVIIGTLYKHQKWKPSILHELSEDHQLTLPEPRSNYCSEKDQLFLEDEMLRIKLMVEDADLKHYVTGVVCAILGYKDKNGSFEIKDWCFPGCVPRSSPAQPKFKGKLVFLSGLDLVNTSSNTSLSLLTEWICGMAGETEAQENVTDIVRVIIAGNSVKTVTKTNTLMGHAEGKAQDAAITKEVAVATTLVDAFLSEIAECCCITLMPGRHDPTSAMLPQKPLHPCILPLTSRYQSFKGATNPWIGKVADRVVMGSSGQPIEDIIKATGETDISPLDWLEKTLLWKHICPTAPDTLPVNPYSVKDPFIINYCPDIYFVGNMDKFETKLWKGEENQVVRLICIPTFSSTHIAVTVDLETLDTDFVCFGSG